MVKQRSVRADVFDFLERPQVFNGLLQNHEYQGPGLAIRRRRAGSSDNGSGDDHRGSVGVGRAFRQREPAVPVRRHRLVRRLQNAGHLTRQLPGTAPVTGLARLPRPVAPSEAAACSKHAPMCVSFTTL
jgi:hypothetical protein